MLICRASLEFPVTQEWVKPVFILASRCTVSRGADLTAVTHCRMAVSDRDRSFCVANFGPYQSGPSDAGRSWLRDIDTQLGAEPEKQCAFLSLSQRMKRGRNLRYSRDGRNGLTLTEIPPTH